MELNPQKEAQKILSTPRLWKEGLFPVDPITICRNLDLAVVETELPTVETELPTNVSGALIKEIGKEPVIVLHKSDSNNRKRFSCAHELGHYISRTESNDIEQKYEYIDLRNSLSAYGTDKNEIFANTFAANLLMPEEEVKQLSQEKKPYFEMALYFGVSPEALKIRLKTLGLLK